MIINPRGSLHGVFISSTRGEKANKQGIRWIKKIMNQIELKHHKKNSTKLCGEGKTMNRYQLQDIRIQIWRNAKQKSFRSFAAPIYIDANTIEWYLTRDHFDLDYY